MEILLQVEIIEFEYLSRMETFQSAFTLTYNETNMLAAFRNSKFNISSSWFVINFVTYDDFSYNLFDQIAPK